MANEELVPINATDVTLAADVERARFMPVMKIDQAMERRGALVDAFSKLLKDGEDFGSVGGSKPTLLQPGAQKLDNLFGLVARYEIIERDEDWTGDRHGGEQFFRYLVRCQLLRNDFVMGEAIGECNSWESKYRYRWIQETEARQRPDFDRLHKRGGRQSEYTFSVDKAETTGRYGKPSTYWQAFKDAIANGTATKIKKTDGKGATRDAWEIDATQYRIPNPEICDQVNTFLKMGQKRAHVGATINATSASEFFTQDMEDRPEATEPAPTPTTAATAPDPPNPKVDEYAARCVDAGSTNNVLAELCDGIVKMSNDTRMEKAWKEAMSAHGDPVKKPAAVKPFIGHLLKYLDEQVM